MLIEFDYIEEDGLGAKADDFFGSVVKHKKPEWWRKLPLFQFGANSEEELLRDHWDNLFTDHMITGRSLKSCPGIGELFKRSVSITTPCDVMLEFNEKAELVKAKHNTSNFKIGPHFGEYPTHLKNNYMIYKIRLNIIIRSKESNIMFSAPTAYEDPYFDIFPGIQLASIYPTELNIFIIVPKNHPQKLLLPTGTPLCMLTFDRPVKEFKRADLSGVHRHYNNSVMKRFLKTNWSKR